MLCNLMLPVFTVQEVIFFPLGTGTFITMVSVVDSIKAGGKTAQIQHQVNVSNPI